MTSFPPIAVSVTHGDLRRSQYPLAVGHYLGDVMVNAEATLDEALGGMLRYRFNLGVYPGELFSSEIVLKPHSYPPGAIVVGLGKIGELTFDSLRRTFATALLRYALTVLDSISVYQELPRSAAFSCVLVGTDGAMIPGVIADSVQAILRGTLDANRALRESGLLEQVRINAVEFVELYEDIAIRAAQIVASLSTLIVQDLGADEAFVGATTMRSQVGGRFMSPWKGGQFSSRWWQRIAVQRKPGDQGAAMATDATTALQFTVLTDRARLEQELSVGQRGLIQQLITRATGSTNVDLDLMNALYQLIIPDQVKDRISVGANLLFMVDRACAGYPFELMAERRTSGLQPFTFERGMLRQFETVIFRQRVNMARANAMLVVGNPKTFLWSDLPGAELEAKEVADLAEKLGLTVERAPRMDPELTIVKLMAGEYRILHLAAHGKFDPDPMKSGVIIGDNILLTPAEILRLPLVPELVFLNCCYLGTMGEARASGPDPRLAASLAEGFIQAGVRAVIAAGWAVDDTAGRTFAITFYNRFLSGESFGNSVKFARDTTRSEHPDVNTWGAYQCYGNPDFCYLLQSAASQKSSRPTIGARVEALQELRLLAADVRWVLSRGNTLLAPLAERFKTLRDVIDNRWEDGEILTAYGVVAAELEDFETAITFYRRALHSPDGPPMVAAEQLVNLIARTAANRVIKDPAASVAVRNDLKDALGWLDWLEARPGSTTERSALRGSLYKRWAVCEPERRRELLRKSQEAYTAGGTKPYTGLNALAMDFVLATKDATELQAQAAVHLQNAQSSSASRDFWSIVGYPDALLFKHLVDGTLAVPGALDDIKQAYARARHAGPTPREWASVYDQVWFLAAMTCDKNLPCYNIATAAALDEVLASLLTALQLKDN